MFINIILPIILIVSLIGLFIYLHIKNRNKDELPITVNPKDVIDYKPSQSALSLFELLLLDEINGHRRKIGARELIPERECRAQAYIHTNYMIANNKPSHDNIFNRKYELLRRGFTHFGENVGYNFSTSKSFFNGYMKSKKHKKIIEDFKFTHIGVRALLDDDGKYYNTLIFARYE